MKWVTFVGLLISLALEIVRYLQRKDQYDRAQLEISAKFLERANVYVRAAATARSDVDHGRDTVVRDPDNRDESVSKPNGNGGRTGE